MFSPEPTTTPRSFPSALLLGTPLPASAYCTSVLCFASLSLNFRGSVHTLTQSQPQTEPVSGVSHTCLVAPEALLKVYPVSVPRLLMVSPVSALGCFGSYRPLSSCWWPCLVQQFSLGKSLLALYTLGNGF